MLELICPNCGAEYELKKIHIPFQDKDSVNCVVCEKQDIYCWDGQEMWTIKLIEKIERGME